MKCHVNNLCSQTNKKYFNYVTSLILIKWRIDHMMSTSLKIQKELLKIGTSSKSYEATNIKNTKEMRNSSFFKDD